MNLLDLPTELLLRILHCIYSPWHIKIQFRSHPNVETYFSHPHISAVPSTPFTALLRTCRTLNTLASPILLRNFTGTLNLHELRSLDSPSQLTSPSQLAHPSKPQNSPSHSSPPLLRPWSHLTPHITTLHAPDPGWPTPSKTQVLRSYLAAFPRVSRIEFFEPNRLVSQIPEDSWRTDLDRCELDEAHSVRELGRMVKARWEAVREVLRTPSPGSKRGDWGTDEDAAGDGDWIRERELDVVVHYLVGPDGFWRKGEAEVVDVVFGLGEEGDGERFGVLQRRKVWLCESGPEGRGVVALDR